VRGGLLLGVVVLVLAAAPASASLKIGAAEDAAKWGDPVAQMDLARLAGFETVRLTLQWSAGQTAPDAGELANTRAAADAARGAGIEPIVALYNRGSGTTPADETGRAQFTRFAAAAARGLPSVTRFIVGNEPNSNVFWMPQFGLDGSDAAAVAYEALLAASYDAIKQARPDAMVVGGALAPRGADNPIGTKPTHSPTTFIRDLGAAYRASGRAARLMDVFDMHVYADNSSLPPSMEHLSSRTIALGDYGKLVSLLGEAFGGTAQPGSTLPVLYGEFGVESIIPTAKAGVYTGTEPAATTKPVDEAAQARYYVEAMKVASCQANVIGLLLFHVTDESDLARWQSGPYYADDTAKSSLAAIRDAANASRGGALTGCPDATPPTAALTAPAAGAVVGPDGITLSATAADDVGVGRVQFLANGVVVGTDFGPPYSVAWRPAVNGTYALAARAQDAAHNEGTSAPVTVRAEVTPSNDGFADAAELSGSDGQVTGTTAGATKEPSEPAHAGDAGGHSVWYRWTAPRRATVTIKTLGSSFDTLLGVYAGSDVAALTPIASNDDSRLGGPTSLVRFNAPAGTTYWIAVDGKGGASGPLVLDWHGL
jgi:Big-like domain-containing protein